MKLFSKTRLNSPGKREENRRKGHKGPLSKRYFDDFEVEVTLDSRGRAKRNLVYIGDTYTALVPDAVFRRRKWSFLLLAVLCAGIFVGANSVNVSSNREGVLAALGVLAVIPLFLVCYACVYRLCKPPTLQRMEYIEASMFLKFGGFLLALLGIVLFVWHGVFSLRHALPSEVGRELSVTAAWGLMAGSARYLWIAELTTEYCQRNREGAVIHREHFKRSGG